MCVRHTYYCHGCQQCFGVPLLSTFDQRLNKFWYFVCRSREPVNVLVDLLCTDDKNCLRRTEKGARENMGTHPSYHNRCSQQCLAQSCYVKAFFMPCRDCFLKIGALGLIIQILTGAELSQMLCHWVAPSKEPKERRGIVG
jgi:hypothetical protein